MRTTSTLKSFNLYRAVKRLGATVFAAALVLTNVIAAVTDLATAPLETSAATLVKPNIHYILDDSGSMDSDYMPDWVNSYDSSYPELTHNSGFNSIYYNSAITYTPPLKYDGTSYNSMTSANTTAWTRVPYDGFGIQTGPGSITTSSTSSTQNLTSIAYYYAFIPGEYCTTPNLRTCTTRTTANASYPYPALLRWCTDSAQTSCQAVRIDTAPTGGSTYTVERYPGQGGGAATTTLTVGNGNSTSVSSVTVNGLQILSAGTAAVNNSNTLASYIVDAINACTAGITGNCAVAGYSATRNRSVVTITAPFSAGNVTATPVVTKSGTRSVTPVAFSGFDAGVPGSNPLTTITSGVDSYSYPGTTVKATTRTDCSSTTCTYAEEMTNFANWWSYYRTRMQMMKSSASIAFNVLTSSYRLGYMSINNNTGTDLLNISDITTGSTGQKAKWYAKLVAANPNNSTPLRSALTKAGRLYAGKYNGSTLNGVTATDPMQYSCQKNFTILSTDGYWNESSPGGYQINGTTAIGDQDSSLARPYLDGNSTSNTLADVAQYYYATDLRTSALSNATGALGTDVADNGTGGTTPQRMVTYTLGLGASGYMLFQSNYASTSTGDYFAVANGSTASSSVCTWQTSGSTCNWPIPSSNTQTTIDDLWHAGVNGRGLYRSAANSSDVQSALAAMLSNIDAQTSNSAAATTSGSNLSVSGNYEFSTNFRSVDWYGQLLSFQIDPVSGTIASSSAWDAQSQLDAKTYSTRNIYTYNPATGSRIDFDWASLTATQQAYFQVANISLSQFCSTGTACIPAAAQVDSTTAGTTTGAGGINLVNFLRGDRSNEGSDSTGYFRPRAHVLGDIVNSQPAYVKKPEFSYTDTGYADYVIAKATRQAMVYVGANDGMLHAFNADTGAEVWSYIPSIVLPNLYKLADKNYSSNHQYFVDGSPHTGDVYFGGAWHTVLVGGLGAGGRGLFALDITTPSAPTVLWEFNSNTAATTGYVSDADLGFTYGTAAFTKLTDGTWVVTVGSGYNNVSQDSATAGSGKGILFVLNAQTGAIIKKISTGVGTTASGGTVTGCAAAPCPSGLSQVRTWVEHAQVNNTAPRVYGGDLYGNVWRFDIDRLTSSGTGTTTVQLLATLSDASGNRQPITSRPELGLVNSLPVVFVGTGELLGVSDLSTTSVQSLYAIKDTLAIPSTSPATTAIYASPRSSACGTSTTNCFVRQTLTNGSGVRTATTNSVNFTTQSGWFIDWPTSGERVSTDPNLQLGTLVVTSNIPSSSGSACSVAGTSYTNYFNYGTGSAVPGASNVGALNSSLASTPTLVRTTSGAVKAIINLADASQTTQSIPISASSRPTRRISWRELIDGR